MPSGHRSKASLLIRKHYENEKGWEFRFIATGVELRRVASQHVTDHLFFNYVRDDLQGLRVQPALGVTFSEVNAVRRALGPVHPDNEVPVTGYVFLNDLVPGADRQCGGWLFGTGADLSSAMSALLQLVDDTEAAVGFFDSLRTVNDYIAAVDHGRWKFVAVMPSFLYALIAVGDTKRALDLAMQYRATVVAAARDKNLVLRESDTRPYDQVVDYLLTLR